MIVFGDKHFFACFDEQQDGWTYVGTTAKEKGNVSCVFLIFNL